MCVAHARYRRLIAWEWNDDPKGESQWTLDRPFAFDPEPTALISIATFRGLNIFSGNTHEDSGVFQFYGSAIENFVSGITGARMGGFVAYGMGDDTGYNPNLYNQFLGNKVTEVSTVLDVHGILS